MVYIFLNIVFDSREYSYLYYVYIVIVNIITHDYIVHLKLFFDHQIIVFS